MSWKKLIEDYPDRFVVGLDTVQNWEEYESVLRAIRFGLLANLSPETAKKVAHKNAQAWFGLRVKLHRPYCVLRGDGCHRALPAGIQAGSKEIRVLR